MVARMVEAYKEVDDLTEIDAIGIDEDGGGTAATKTLTWGGTATAPGTIHLYVGDQYVPVAIETGDDGTATATKVDTAVSAVPTLPYTSGSAAAVQTLTCKWAGETGSDIVVQVNYLSGQALPPGISVVIADGVAGATDPSIASALAAVDGDQYDTIVIGYADAANLTLLENELSDRDDGVTQQPGIAFAGGFGNFAAVTGLSSARNSQYLSVVPCGENSPSAPWTVAARWAAISAEQAQIDPARPLQTLEVPGHLPPPLTNQWDFAERTLLFGQGASIWKVVGGKVVVERMRTTYLVNGLAAADTSYQDVITLRTLSFLRFSLRTRIQLRYPRHKLAKDGTRIGPGQLVATPVMIKGTILNLFSEWESAGLVEDFDQFSDELIVEINANDPDRVDVRMGPNLINAFRVFAGQIQFIK
ncbi:MAG: phage tail sheath C-terminal domain-containing protein [Myxococcota bacterium]